MSEPRIPTEVEIETLPRRARVAFAARCARRVLPLFRHYWPNSPVEHVAAIIRAVEVTEQAAATTQANVDAAPTAAVASASVAVASVAAAARSHHTATTTDYSEAIAEHVARVAEHSSVAAARFSSAAVYRAAKRVLKAAPAAADAMLADFNALVYAAAQGQWTDDTPVSPEFFGPLWPHGTPLGWPIPAGPPGVPATLIKPGRVRYSKRTADGVRRVIYDRCDDGTETFAEYEDTEVRSYPFSPSPPERRVARWLLSQGRSGDGIFLEDVPAFEDVPPVREQLTTQPLATTPPISSPPQECGRTPEGPNRLAPGTEYLTPHQQKRNAQLHSVEAVSQFQPDDPVPSRQLWTLVRCLGRGSFGEVWRVKHEWKSDVGAVKFCTHPHARQLLLKHEKRMVVAAMKRAECHPNIVPLWDYELDGETPWLLYEFVTGNRTLADTIHEWGALEPTERIRRAARLLATLAGALGHFHRHDPPLVHRDMKPDNVMMQDDTPRITDFGIGGAAVEALASDSTGLFQNSVPRVPSLAKNAGNPRYAPKEQREGQTPDPRNDVYTLGVVAYQMIKGDTEAEPGADVEEELREIGTPEGIIVLIRKSISANPTRRPKDAGEWEVALSGLLPSL